METENTQSFEGVLEDYSPFTKLKTEFSETDLDTLIELSSITIESLKPISKLLKSENENDENDDEFDENYEIVKDTIRTLKTQKDELKIKLDNLIKDIIGLMYKGVLINNEMSIRNGKIYRFRARYDLDTPKIIQIIKKHLQEVSEKLSETNLDILEFIISLYDENEPRMEHEDFEFDTLKLINEIDFNDDDNINFKKIKFETVNTLRINSYSNFEFYEKKIDETTKCYLENNIKKMFFLKFKVQINELVNKFIKRLEDELKLKETYINEIGNKGKNLLMIKELRRDNGKK